MHRVSMYLIGKKNLSKRKAEEEKGEVMQEKQQEEQE